MNTYKYALSYDDSLIARLYDQSETFSDDIELIRNLISGSPHLNILECFSGTGRILVPLTEDGHSLTGIELSPCMNAFAVMKTIFLPDDASDRVSLRVRDVFDGSWGEGFDLIILGGNCFYELPSAELQKKCVELAHASLASGGRIFIDNNDYKGDWGDGPFGEERVIFEGEGSDGSYGKLTKEGVCFDAGEGVLTVKRTWLKRSPDGAEEFVEYLAKQRPVSHDEIESWLHEYGFKILSVFGDRQGNPYTPESDRAIFWAEKA